MNTSAYVYLVKILSSRDYSEYNLRQKLKDKIYSIDEIENAIFEIKSKGYLREDLYACSRIKIFMEKGYSPEYILQKMEQENITICIENINAVFTEYRISQEDQIERLVRKKMQDKSDFDIKSENKILRYLISKGHDFSLAKKIMTNIMEEAHSLQY
jgi:regulatory protein